MIVSKARHRGDILEFTIKNTNHLFVSGATFNMFVRGEDWKAENERSSSSSSSSNGGKNNAFGMQHSDENGAAGSSATATVTTPINRDEYTSSESLPHKLHGNSKNVNSNHISISINRFVHRHQQQVSACIIIFAVLKRKYRRKQNHTLKHTLNALAANKLLNVIIGYIPRMSIFRVKKKSKNNRK